MAARLTDLHESGDTVAVVGIDHLDSLAERLDETDEWTDPSASSESGPV